MSTNHSDIEEVPSGSPPDGFPAIIQLIEVAVGADPDFAHLAGAEILKRTRLSALCLEDRYGRHHVVRRG
jgi:hypothetical protein